MIVIDASIALAWILHEHERADASAALEYVTGSGAYVPGTFQSEVAHGLLQAERKGRLKEADVAEALSDILALPLVVELPDPHVVIAAARAHGLTCYDASYLALALQAQLPLATVDASLGTAARAAKCAWKMRA